MTVMADRARNTHDVASMSYDLSSSRLGVPLAKDMIPCPAPSDTQLNVDYVEEDAAERAMFIREDRIQEIRKSNWSKKRSEKRKAG
jgi:hypothetical protein